MKPDSRKKEISFQILRELNIHKHKILKSMIQERKKIISFNIQAKSKNHTKYYVNSIFTSKNIDEEEFRQKGKYHSRYYAS